MLASLIDRARGQNGNRNPSRWQFDLGRHKMASPQKAHHYFSSNTTAQVRLAEIEGDMLKALVEENSKKLIQKYLLWLIR
jgi:hypothetical protein